jgi:tetratricopeptide (TPR) repeat protein
VHDVLIVGGGLVGASLAIALDRLGLDVGLLEAAPAGALPAVFDQRNLSLAEASVHALLALDVLPRLRAPTGAIARIHITRAGDFGRVLLSSRDHGRDAFGRHDFAECDLAYGRLIERFPESRYIHTALYNRGLCLEQLGEHGRAATHFRRHAQLSTELRDQRDGEFRWGYNLIKTGDFPTALDLYTRLLTASDLQPLDRAECHLRRGIAHARLDRAGEAEKDLKQAMALTREGSDGHVQGSELYAEAHFRRGEIYQRLSHNVGLKLPVASMRADLVQDLIFIV